MKFGFIAMSGVRAVNKRLMETGLTLPGYVERRRVVASMPSLSLLTLGALTPPDIEIEYREIPDLRAEPELPLGYDLVAIASYTAQIKDAYRVADFYTSRGVPTVMGGLHVSVLPDEARAHGAVAVVGEGEPLWPRVVEDFRRGHLDPEYRARTGESYSLGHAPIPRYELLDLSRYNRIPVQTSRGCPHHCEFCAGSSLLTQGYSMKTPYHVAAEVRHIRSMWPHPFIEFADDNSFVLRSDAKWLLRSLRGEGLKWFAETDISIARDPELLSLMRETGCRQVLIGLESPGPAGLDGLELRRNWKLERLPEYEGAIRAIQSRGITVNGCFVLGLDGHTQEIFDQVYDFVERSGLYEVQITVLTPFPGTPVYDRLKREGRLLVEDDWDRCTLFDVNFVPQGMSPEQLEEGFLQLSQRLYSQEAIDRRRDRFFRSLRRDVAPALAKEGG